MKTTTEIEIFTFDETDVEVIEEPQEETADLTSPAITSEPESNFTPNFTKNLAAIASGKKDDDSLNTLEPDLGTSHSQEVNKEEPLLDEEYLYRTKNASAENPLWRIIVALLLFSGLGAGVFFLGSIASTITNGGKKDPSKFADKQLNSPSSNEKLPVETKDSLKAELALIEQDETETIPQPQPQPQPQPTSVLEQKPQPKPTPVPATSPKPQPRIVTPTPIPKPQVAEKKEDPLEQWARLSQLGAMGHDGRMMARNLASNPSELQTETSTPLSNSSPSELLQNRQRERESNSQAVPRIQPESESNLVATTDLAVVKLGGNNNQPQNVRPHPNDLANNYSSLPNSRTRQFILGSSASTSISSINTPNNGVENQTSTISPPKKISNHSETNNYKSTYSQHLGTSQTNPQTIVETERVMGDSSTVVPIGSTVAATVITEIISSESQPFASRATIALSEPLLDAHNRVALDAGTSLIVEVDRILSNGIVYLKAVAISYYDSQNRLQQQQLPPNALLITGKNNSPLIAENLENAGGSNLGQDILIGAMGAGSKGFEILNLPEEEIVEQSNSSYGSYRRRSHRSDRSLVRGALEGAFETTKERLSERSERIIEDRQNRPATYRIRSQTEVRVYVNSLFEVYN